MDVLLKEEYVSIDDGNIFFISDHSNNIFL